MQIAVFAHAPRLRCLGIATPKGRMSRTEEDDFIVSGRAVTSPPFPKRAAAVVRTSPATTAALASPLPMAS